MVGNKEFQRKHNWLPISEQIRLQHKTISRRQARLIIEKHPHLQHHRQDRLFFLELIKWAQRKDPDTGLPYVHYYEIAAVFGKSPKHCNTEQELEGVKQRFLHALEWTGYSNNENENERGKARMITNTGLGELANAFLYDYDPERVYADSLKPFSKRKQADACRALKRENEVIRWSYIDQQVLADYLRNHSLQPFKRVVDANYYTTQREAFRCKDSGSQLNILSEIKDMPQPIYYLSGKERSRCPRIFGKGIPLLKKEVRHALCPDWIDLDIQSCQATIVAGLWGAPMIQEYIRSGTSLWTVLYEHMGIASQDRKRAKTHLKEALYSVIYGKPVRYAEEMLTDALEDEHIIFYKTFSTCSIIGELYSTIKRAKVKIKREGGAMSAYGWLPLADTDIDSFLSYIVQSYELFLIAACYGEAMVAERTRTKSKQFKIMLHQHDGISIALGEEADRETVIAGLKAAVKFAGEEVGIVAYIVEDDAEVKPEIEQEVLVAAGKGSSSFLLSLSPSLSLYIIPKKEAKNGHLAA